MKRMRKHAVPVSDSWSRSKHMSNYWCWSWFGRWAEAFSKSWNWSGAKSKSWSMAKSYSFKRSL
jgi:hypothetical protein